MIRLKRKVGDTVVEVEGETWLEAAKLLGGASWLTETKCGDCGGADLVYDTRVTKEGWVYISLSCKSCRARLDIGQTKNTPDVFIRRRDMHGNIQGKNGWYRYDPNAAPQPQYQQPPQQPPQYQQPQPQYQQPPQQQPPQQQPPQQPNYQNLGGVGEDVPF